MKAVLLITWTKLNRYQELPVFYCLRIIVRVNLGGISKTIKTFFIIITSISLLNSGIAYTMIYSIGLV